MKKKRVFCMMAVLVVLLLLLSVCGCDTAAPNDTSTPTTTTATTTTTTAETTVPREEYDPPVLTVDRIPKTADWKTAGLESAGIGEVKMLFERSVGTSSNITYYILECVKQFDSYDLYKYYLALETVNTVFLKELDGIWRPPLDIDAVDLDGQPGLELTVHGDTGGNGGYGQYASYVFKGTESGIVTLFDSSNFDTGYSATLEAPFKVIMTNRFTGSKTAVDYRKSPEASNYFDESGNPKREEQFVLIDTIFRFETIDRNFDGVYELWCTQYTSLHSHVDYIGDTAFWMTYDAETGKFVIDQSGFIPSEEYA